MDLKYIIKNYRELNGKGVVGGYPVGKIIDIYLTHNEIPYEKKIIKLMTDIKAKVKNLRRITEIEDKSFVTYLLLLIREDYYEKIEELNKKYKFEESLVGLLRNFVNAVTKYDEFVKINRDEMFLFK